MLPLSDDNRGRSRQPIVTWVLIGLNLLIYFYQWMLSQPDLYKFLDEWAVIPQEITDGHAYYTLLTCAFLHGSWFHVGSNMLFLWIFGDNVEDVMGHWKYLIFYVLVAVIASLAQVMIDPHSQIPLVGASGAVSGVLAAYVVLFPNGRIRTAVTLGFFITIAMLPAWMMIGYWIVIQIISGVASLNAVGNTQGGVAFFAHIGGFVAGLLLVFVFRNRDREEQQRMSRGSEMRAQTWGVGSNRR